MENVSINEAGGSLPASVGRRFRARLIEGPRWGSSGYYSSETLQQAANDRVFGKDLPVFLDHPGVTERDDRPERSVRDLAGHLSTDAVWENDGLYADITVYPHMAPIVEAMADHIGMSIRAAGEASPGEAEGRRGVVITKLTEAMSVDFVTAAGAGGKITQLLESARAALTQTVPAEERDVTTSESQEDSMPEITEADKALSEAQAQVAALETERDNLKQRAEAAEAELNKRDLLDQAAGIAKEAVKDLPEVMANRIVAEAMRDLPRTDEGALDADKLGADLTSAIEAEKKYAEALAPQGVTGFGKSAAPAGVTESDVEKAIAKAFGRTIKEAN